MIFNHTIYGTISGSPTSGYTRLHFYRSSLQETVTKDYLVTDGKYQFNLGDYDLLDINDKIFSGDIILIEYYDINDAKLFSGMLELDLTVSIQEYNLDLNSYVLNNDVASFAIAEKVIKTTEHSVKEHSEFLYNYFMIEDLNNSKIIDNNNSEFKFIPKDASDYLLLQRALNKTNNTVTERTYQFRALVSSATITRSNKCKGINDAIKILFMGMDTFTPEIEIIKDETIIESGTMSLEGSNLYSYNYVFGSAGHHCFRINYGSESFITNFRVQKSDFKVYYIDESLLGGLPITAEYFYINDVNNSLGSLTFNDIGTGLYSTEGLNVEYGDYLFRINNEDFVTSFEECSPTSEDSALNGSQTSQEIYWIFPNNILN